MLSINHVTKKFGNKYILRDVSLEVNKAEIAVLLGASGVGKSTLLRILNNLETVDTGTFTLDGQVLNLATVNKEHLSGMVFQSFNLFEHLTALENITLALEKVLKIPHEKAIAQAQDLLRQYGLSDKEDAYPMDLSGGQKQRLALARALALKPQIVCLDEPTSALDPLLTASVAKTIQDLAHQNFIVIVATHDISLLERLACTVYFMKDGAIVEKGSSQEILSHPDKFSQVSRFIKGQSAL